MDQEYLLKFRNYENEFKAYKAVSTSELEVNLAQTNRSWLNLEIQGFGSGSFASPLSPSWDHGVDTSALSLKSSSSYVSAGENIKQVTLSVPSTDGFKAPHSEKTQDVEASVRVTVRKGSKKGHSKSRQGCYNCKKRKIKVCPDQGALLCVIQLTESPYSVKKRSLNARTAERNKCSANIQPQRHFQSCSHYQHIQRRP